MAWSSWFHRSWRHSRRFLPKSLRGRLTLLVLGTVLVAQAATLTTVSYYRDKFMEEVALDYIVTTIRTLRAAVSQVPAEERAEFVRNASQNQWRLWSRTLPAEARLQRQWRRREDGDMPPPPPPDDVRRDLRSLVRQLNAQLNDGTRVALSRGPDPEVFISLAPNTSTDDGPQLREWLVIPLERLDPPVSTPLIVVWLGGLGVLLLLAATFSWHIARPLTRLAEAADRLGEGKPQRVSPSGPFETRALGERFNAMLDALAEAESVRRTLLAGLPHDLKGPLSRMWLRIEMADDPALQTGLRHDLQDMQRMVDQFIGFVRGTDPGTYRFAPMLLNEWLPERVTAWTSVGSPVVLTPLPERTITIQGDAVALARLLDNLIGNALHHGAPQVEVHLERLEETVRLTVRDHGEGIAPDRRTEALRPFARLDDARTRTGSVGLGLALVDAIVRAHRGELVLANADTGGLQVVITLPLAADTVTPTLPGQVA